MRETFSAVLMVGLALAIPFVVALAIVASDKTLSYAVGANDREYIPYYEEEAYLGYE